MDSLKPQQEPSLPATTSASLDDEVALARLHLSLARRHRDIEGGETSHKGPKFLLRVWHQWWKVTLPLGIALAAAACLIVAACFVPEYRATAYLTISKEESPVGRGGDSMPDRNTWVQTQVQLILSPVILEETLAIENVAKNPEIAAAPDPVAWLGRHLALAPMENSELYKLEFTCRDPDDAAMITNAIATTYLRRQVDGYQGFKKRVVERLDAAMQGRLAEVKRLQEVLVSSSRELGTSDPILPGGMAVLGEAGGALATMRDQLVAAEVEWEKATAEWRAAETMLREPLPQQRDAVIGLEIEALPVVTEARQEVAAARRLVNEIRLRSKDPRSNPSFAAAERRLSDAEANLNQLRRSLTEERRKENDARYRADLERQIVNLKQRQANAETARQVLQQRYDALAKSSQITGGKRAEVELLRGQLARQEKIVELIGSSKLFLEADLGARPNVTIEKPATPPRQPVEAMPFKLLGLAGLIGLILPFSLAALRERTLQRIDDAEQLANASTFDVLGEIAELPAKPVLVRSESSRRRMMRSVGMFCESVDAFRTCLFLAPNADKIRVITVTSAMSGEGKTTVASQLAASIARCGGVRVLLIDADLRSPDLHSVMQVELSPGLSDVLSAAVSLDAAVANSSVGMVSVLPAGKLSAMPQQLVNGRTLQPLIEAAKKRFDYVIIDAPPVLCASEAMVVAKEADGILFCALRDVSRSHHVRRAAERLLRAGAKPLGAVLSGLPARRYASQYGSYGYYAAMTTSVHRNGCVDESGWAHR